MLPYGRRWGVYYLLPDRAVKSHLLRVRPKFSHPLTPGHRDLTLSPLQHPRYKIFGIVISKWGATIKNAHDLFSMNFYMWQELICIWTLETRWQHSQWPKLLEHSACLTLLFYISWILNLIPLLPLHIKINVMRIKLGQWSLTTILSLLACLQNCSSSKQARVW